MSTIKISSLDGIRKIIANMCDSKENGGNKDTEINAGREKGLYESSVESISGNTFIFNGKTYNADGSVFEKATEEPNNNQNNFTIVENDKGHKIKLDFKWIDLKEINNYDIRPSFIKEILNNENLKFNHLIFNELD